MRDPSLDPSGKVRKIEVLGRPQSSRISRTGGPGTATVEPEVETAAESELEAPAHAVEVVEPDEDVIAVVTAKEAPRTPEGKAKEAAIAAELIESAEAPALPKETAAKVETSPLAERPKAPLDKSREAAPVPKAESPASPHRPEDYIAPGGVSGKFIRDMEMRPRANVTDQQRGKAKPEKKPAKPAMPFLTQAPGVAIPKPKKTKTAEEPAAQKPDFKLTGDMLKNDAPLRQQYKRHIEDRAKEEETGKPRIGGGGTHLKKRPDKDREMEEAQTKGKPQAKQRRRKNNLQDEVMQQSPGKGIRKKRKGRKGSIVYNTEAEVQLPITIRNLSEAMGRPARDLIGVLFRKGLDVKINDQITEETALELALELGVDLVILRGRDIEEELQTQFEQEEDPELLEARPPVITILGHVDHGKTTLLDTIRQANVAAGEAGGITQHIAAYQVEHEGQKLTFVDTPGHAAFGEMRARGANVTDIIVLVVAADDGVMPQTVECISHAKAAKVPIVVAMNKIDRPDTDEQRVLSELATHDILAAEWGGDVEVVRTSALKNTGIDKLLETLLLTAELQDYKANPHAPATGICLEAFRDEGRGVLAWIMVKKGTLKIGDVVLCGSAYGRVRAIYDDRDKEVQEAGPSTPVKIAGLDSMPGAGDQFYTLADIEDARLAANERRSAGIAERLGTSTRPRDLSGFLSLAAAGKVQDLPLILKADTPGSLEALNHELTKFEHPEVRVQIVHEGVGGVNESDVSLANAAGAIIIAFHVVADDNAAQQADREGVEIRRYDIIYEVTDHIKLALEGLLVPDRVQETTGRALVLQTFKITRFGTIAGCRVLNGTIERNSRVNVIRDQKIINDYEIASLKREKDDAREVREGMECGIRLQGFNDIKEGDLLEAYKVKEVKRKLE
jgi:translation initiation factor IF-2